MSANADPEQPADLSFHGLSVTPDRAARPVEPLPAPAAGFTFVRELGRGGMGVVYEAADDTGRHVAVKVMSRRLDGNPDAAGRFEREARLAGSISHPNCVFVYGAHTIHGAPAISMELMSGETLEDRIRGAEPLAPDTAVQWILEALEGIEAAHALGIVHRDVKPSNCFLTEDGKVKVGDFGLSRSIESDLALTQTGAFLGSPLYASPEQVRGRGVDERSDLYSVGATLYALLARRPPHAGTALGDVLAQIVSEPPPPLADRPGIPRGLEAVVMRALAKDPARRFESCAAFRRALLVYAPGRLTPGTLGLRIGACMIDMMASSLLFDLACIGLWYAGVRYASADPEAPYAPVGPLASLAAYAAPLLWFAVFESWFGCALGKRLLGLRVVEVDGGRVSLWRATIRAAVFLAPIAVPEIIFGATIGTGANLARLGGYCVPLLTMRKRNGYRGIHELLTRTRVLRTLAIGEARRVHALHHEGTRPPTGYPETIGGYAVEGFVGRTDRGALLLARDPELGRSVWVHLAEGGSAPGQDAPVATGLRWLRRGETPAPYDVYESPGGVPLRQYAAMHGPRSWPTALEDLRGLAADLAARGDDLALEQLWADRWGRVRILDFAVDGRTRATPVQVLDVAARFLLLGERAAASGLPPDLPVHADASVRRLLGLDPPFATLDEAVAALKDLGMRPAAVSRGRRVAQILLTGLWLTTLVFVTFTAVEAEAASGHTVDAAARIMIQALTFVAIFAVPSVLLAILLRGGLTYAMLGLRLRTRQGHRASRLRCGLRAAVVCLPAIPALASSWIPVPAEWRDFMALGSTILIYGVLAAWSIVNPAEGPADRIARTRIVRR